MIKRSKEAGMDDDPSDVQEPADDEPEEEEAEGESEEDPEEEDAENKL